jgi:nucleolin
MTMTIDDGCKLFVAGLPDTITEDVLRQLFEATGASVVEASMPRDRATGRPRGFAFVTLASEDQANVARDALDNSIQSGRSISVRPFQGSGPKRGEGREGRPFERGERPERPFERGGPPRGERPERPFERGGPPRGERPERPFERGGPPRGGTDDRTLYLGNLPYGVSTEDLESRLTEAGIGPVVRVTLPQDPEGRPRGFGFVTLGSVEAAQAAVTALDGVEVGGRRISASVARGRGERGPPRPAGPGGGGSHRSDAAGGGSGGEGRSDFRERSPRSMPAGDGSLPVGAVPDEGRRGDGRRRKEKKKKKATRAAGPERDEGRKDRSRGRRGRWGEEDEF